MDKKLKRVTFHYDDDTSKYIEGDELDRWNGFNMQVAVFCTAHRMNPDWSKVKWEEEKNEKNKKETNTELSGDKTKVL